MAAGLILPGLMALAFVYRDALPFPDFISQRMGNVSGNKMLMLFAVMILVGFYGPAYWLSSRAKEFKHRVELGFLNALDLMQISIASGLGFDASLARVAVELQTTAPEIAQKFIAAQHAILAGRDREGAFHAMAERLAIGEPYSFVNMVLQSIRFGTLMSEAADLFRRNARTARIARARKGKQVAGLDVGGDGLSDDAVAADCHHRPGRAALRPNVCTLIARQTKKRPCNFHCRVFV